LLLLRIKVTDAVAATRCCRRVGQLLLLLSHNKLGGWLHWLHARVLRGCCWRPLLYCMLCLLLLLVACVLCQVLGAAGVDGARFAALQLAAPHWLGQRVAQRQLHITHTTAHQ
jgi:hypothetical protein